MISKSELDFEKTFIFRLLLDVMIALLKIFYLHITLCSGC